LRDLTDSAKTCVSQKKKHIKEGMLVCVDSLTYYYNVANYTQLLLHL
jgi:hypothetical protein